MPSAGAQPVGARRATGFVGFAWFDFVETMATHAVRVITEARDRDVVAVSEAAFTEWNAEMRRQGRIVHLYLTACNPGLLWCRRKIAERYWLPTSDPWRSSCVGSCATVHWVKLSSFTAGTGLRAPRPAFADVIGQRPGRVENRHSSSKEMAERRPVRGLAVPRFVEKKLELFRLCQEPPQAGHSLEPVVWQC